MAEEARWDFELVRADMGGKQDDDTLLVGERAPGSHAKAQDRRARATGNVVSNHAGALDRKVAARVHSDAGDQAALARESAEA